MEREYIVTKMTFVWHIHEHFLHLKTRKFDLFPPSSYLTNKGMIVQLYTPNPYTLKWTPWRFRNSLFSSSIVHTKFNRKKEYKCTSIRSLKLGVTTLYVWYSLNSMLLLLYVVSLLYGPPMLVAIGNCDLSSPHIVCEKMLFWN